jgi:ABC-type glycerol-3-phosphate transport system permease component
LRNILVGAGLATSAAEASGAEMSAEGLKAAAIVLVALPIVVIYPFVQKYFEKGVLIGSVKG